MAPATKALVLMGVAIAIAAGWGWRERYRLELAREHSAALEAEERILGAQMQASRRAGAAIRSDRQDQAGAQTPVGAAVLRLFARLDAIRARFAQQPKERIPEMDLLTEEDWVSIANFARHLDTEGGMRWALAGIRTRAESHAADLLGQAMRARAAAQPGVRLTDLAQLQLYLSAALTPAMSARYRVLPFDPALGFDEIEERREAMPDPDFEHQVQIGPNVIGWRVARDQTAVQAALAAYNAAHGGAHPATQEALLPYFQDPAAAAHYREILRLDQEANAP